MINCVGYYIFEIFYISLKSYTAKSLMNTGININIAGMN